MTSVTRLEVRWKNLSILDGWIFTVYKFAPRTEKFLLRYVLVGGATVDGVAGHVPVLSEVG